MDWSYNYSNKNVKLSPKSINLPVVPESGQHACACLRARHVIVMWQPVPRQNHKILAAKSPGQARDMSEGHLREQVERLSESFGEQLRSVLAVSRGGKRHSTFTVLMSKLSCVLWLRRVLVSSWFVFFTAGVQLVRSKCPTSTQTEVSIAQKRASL